MGYTCDAHPDTPAVLLVTNLGNGDVVALGPECVEGWAAMMAGTFQAIRESADAAAPTDPVTDEPTDEPADEVVPPLADDTPPPAAADPAPGDGTVEAEATAAVST